MEIDIDRVRAIIAAPHSYYDKEAIAFERECPMTPDIGDFLRRSFKPEQRVLDIGCGSGKTLIGNAARFKAGVGIDNSAEHVALANKNREAAGVRNVEFVECPSFQLPFEPESFDFAFSERGPLAGCAINIQAALRVLRLGGLIFGETLGSKNLKEADLIFHPEGFFKSYRQMSREEDVKVVFERNGVDVRLVSSHIEKLVFPDLYAWLNYQCSLWGSEGWPPILRLERDLERFIGVASDETGRIRLTYHLIWVGGVKQAHPPEYWEHQHFPS